jgi:uncharacterized protein YkwD
MPSLLKQRTPIAMLALVGLVTVLLSACNPVAENANLAAINQLRANYQVPALTRTAELDAKARAQADRMAKAGSIFHSENLTGGVSAGWTLIGENIASADSIENAEAALEASQVHLDNLTNPVFSEVGLGVTVKNGVFYLVQIFVSR